MLLGVAASRQSAAEGAFAEWRRSAETPLPGDGSREADAVIGISTLWRSRGWIQAVNSWFPWREDRLDCRHENDLPTIPLFVAVPYSGVGVGPVCSALPGPRRGVRR